MTDFSISTTQSTASTLTGDDTLTITSTGLLKPAGPAVVWNLATASAGLGVVVTNNGSIAPTSGRALDTSGTATAAVSFTLDNNGAITGASDVMRIQKSLMGGAFAIDNTGSITANAGRGFNLQEYSNLAGFTLTNHATGTIQSTDDAVRLTSATVGLAFTGTLHVDNFGTIKTVGAGSGQALDFNDVAATALNHITIDNESTGVLQSGDADAVRGGAFATINNHGQIVSQNFNSSSTGNDAIDFQANAGGVVNNFSDGVITSARHGVTGDEAVTITNDGQITGQLGSGVNLDTASTVTTTLTNQADGVITGNAAGTSDGDGVDIDGLVHIDNYGQIKGLGTWTGGLSEGVTVGGGEIHNYEGGLIYSVQRAITVDDSNLGDAFAATTIVNEGTIQGDDGEAISITDSFADTITNKGTIVGSIATGDGDDVLNLYTGSASGSIDGGAGSDTIHLVETLAPPAGLHPADVVPTTLAATANVETLDVDSGQWLIDDADSFSGGVTIASGASLQIGNADAAGAVTGDIGDAGSLSFDRTDHATFSGAISGHGAVVQDGAGTLTLSGHSSYDGGTEIASGVLEITTADGAGTGAITFDAGAQTLALAATAFTAGDFGLALEGMSAGDAVDLEAIGLATGVSLAAGNVLTVSGGAGGDLTLHLDPAQDFTGKTFQLTSDGNGGTTVTIVADSSPVITGGGAVDHDVMEAGVDGKGLDTAAATAITFSDPDAADTPAFDTTGWTEVGTSALYAKAGEYGSATLDTATGVVTYHLDNADPDTRALTSGDHVLDGFVITVADGHGGAVSQNVVFDILGDNDIVTGTAAADTLAGTAFADLLKGAAGDDILSGGAGDDTLQGGAGSDTASYAGRNLGVTADLGAGTATGDGADTLVSIENLVGSNKSDSLAGDDHANLLDGGAGNDVLFGGGGADTLTGGAGDDRFVFDDLADSKAKAPVLITDLEGGDRIDLSDIDANTAKDGDQKFKVVDAFTHHAGQLTLAYDAVHDRTVLSVDVDGDAHADMTVWLSGDQTGFNHFVL